MDIAALEVQVRDMSQKAKALRRGKMIPASFYGHGIENVNIQMDYQTFRKLYRVAGDNTVIDLNIEGVGMKKALVHRVDYHPVTDNFQYIEFINVRMDEKVTTTVPVHLEGQAPAVKEMGGVLMQSLNELEIECLPGDLIHEVTVSIESLVDFHTAIHVSDIKVPATITVITPLETNVAAVSAPREEEAELPVDAPDVASVAVEGEKVDEESSEGSDE
jgi:large subunit ribosomal protein L25